MKKLSEELYDLYLVNQEDVLISYEAFINIRDRVQQLESKEDECKEHLMNIYALGYDVYECGVIRDYVSDKLKLV